jgi:parvin
LIVFHPAKVVKKSLVTFVNKHLNKLNLEVNDLDTQFADGVYLCLLTGLLEGYFVPLYEFHLTPQVSTMSGGWVFILIST